MSRNQPGKGVVGMGMGRKGVTARGNCICEDSDV